jgi:hypothetical protein
MADVDPDDLFREPNDDAYLKKEVRVGPPLEYVAEKFGHALVAVHDLLLNMRRLKQDDALMSQAIYAFRSQLTGYLALKNMMALLNDDGFFERMESSSGQSFKDWLNRIDHQGSVT